MLKKLLFLLITVAALASCKKEYFDRDKISDEYYLKIQRTSLTSATITIYSNSGYTTVVESKTLTFASTLTNLRYVGLKPCSINNPVNSFTITVDDGSKVSIAVDLPEPGSPITKIILPIKNSF